MNEQLQLEVRNLKFGFGESVPKYWLGGRRAVSTFWDNLSIFFPAGERFFIQSVKAHVDQVQDPELLEAMRRFYAQEGFHSREHVRYNEMTAQRGHAVAEMEARVERLLERVKSLLPERIQLAVTAALEHHTALLADLLLRHPELLEQAHPTMRALWRWHAAEEAEHKGVAFDVYEATWGNYPIRAIVMVIATLIFWAKVAEQQVRMMNEDGTLTSGSEWRDLFRFFFVDPGGAAAAIPLFLDYFRPGFHPWDHDNRELLEAWKRELSTEPAYGQAA